MKAFNFYINPRRNVTDLWYLFEHFQRRFTWREDREFIYWIHKKSAKICKITKQHWISQSDKDNLAEFIHDTY